MQGKPQMSDSYLTCASTMILGATNPPGSGLISHGLQVFSLRVDERPLLMPARQVVSLLLSEDHYLTSATPIPAGQDTMVE